MTKHRKQQLRKILLTEMRDFICSGIQDYSHHLDLKEIDELKLAELKKRIFSLTEKIVNKHWEKI